MLTVTDERRRDVACRRIMLGMTAIQAGGFGSARVPRCRLALERSCLHYVGSSCKEIRICMGAEISVRVAARVRMIRKAGEVELWQGDSDPRGCRDLACLGGAVICIMFVRVTRPMSGVEISLAGGSC